MHIISTSAKGGTKQLHCRALDNDSGVTIIRNAGEMVVSVPFLSGYSLYWAVLNGEIHVATNAAAIAKKATAKIDDGFLAASLSPNIPFPIAEAISPWQNIRRLPAAKQLHIDSDMRIHECWECSHATVSQVHDEPLTGIRSRLLQMADQYARRAESISIDLSGGLDSSATAYILAARGVSFEAYRFAADTIFNDDASIASHVMADIGVSAESIAPLSQHSKAFDAAFPYPNAYQADQPIYWSDTEGYVGWLADRNDSTGDGRIHLTGLGGDELFSPMPAWPWSVLRERPWQAISLIRLCSRLGGMSLGSAARALLNSKSLHSSLKASIANACEVGAVHGVAGDWHEPFLFPRTLSAYGREVLCEKLHDVLSGQRLQPLCNDRSKHQLLCSLAMQSRILRQANAMFGAHHIEFTSLFLDPAVICHALRIPEHRKTADKSIMKSILEGIVPDVLFARQEKGDYTTSLYRAWAYSASTMLADVYDGILVDKGLINRAYIERMSSMPSPPTSFLFEMQRLAATERWARNVQ